MEYEATTCLSMRASRQARREWMCGSPSFFTLACKGLAAATQREGNACRINRIPVAHDDLIEWRFSRDVIKRYHEKKSCMCFSLFPTQKLPPLDTFSTEEKKSSKKTNKKRKSNLMRALKSKTDIKGRKRNSWPEQEEQGPRYSNFGITLTLHGKRKHFYLTRRAG